MSDPNWDQAYTGAGPVDTAAQIVKSINDSDPMAVVGNAVAASLDLLSVIDNPLDVVATSTLGWVLEHVWFLDGFLDNTVGDPAAIDNAAATLSAAAVRLDELAAEQFTAFNDEIPIYRNGASPSKVPFEERVGPRAEELNLLSLQCKGLGESLIIAGMWVATIRGVMRDLLAEFAWWWLQKAGIALATLLHSGGSSLGIFLAETVRGGVQTSGKLMTKLAECSETLAALATTTKRLAELVGTPRRTAAASGLKNLLPSTGKAIDDLGQANQPSAYDRARENAEAEPAPEPEVLQPEIPQKPPEIGFTPPRQQSSAWQTSGSLDEP